MTYELAKQLKDAGFPQRYFDGIYDAYVPTLSELIEACGDRFVGLERRDISEWFAIASLFKLDDAQSFKGKSPEEAVARLWLALQKDE